MNKVKLNINDYKIGDIFQSIEYFKEKDGFEYGEYFFNLLIEKHKRHIIVLKQDKKRDYLIRRQKISLNKYYLSISIDFRKDIIPLKILQEQQKLIRQQKLNRINK